MPEGDTIHKLANYLAPRLETRVVDRVRAADPSAMRLCGGQRVSRVFAKGKHLFIEFENEWLLRSHLGMYGSWHRYRENEAWKKPRRQASLEIAAEGEVFVCFNAKEVELVHAPGVRKRIVDTRLGPDLACADFYVTAMAQRAREFLEDDAPLTDVLLDQRIACGIGNVYKSEVLFIEGLPPLATLGMLGDEQLNRLYATAAQLIQRNLGGGPRVTRFESDGAGRLWVYGRGGLPCLRCDSRINSARMGKNHRSTYFCEQCQP
jgi:endonuclease-8